jgi:hypothetical protein
VGPRAGLDVCYFVQAELYCILYELTLLCNWLIQVKGVLHICYSGISAETEQLTDPIQGEVVH